MDKPLDMTIRDGNKVRGMRSIFRVCCYTNFILRSNMINLRSNFLQQFSLSSVHLKFDIRSIKFELVIFLDK